MQSDRDTLEVTVLSGALGSGKTTLLTQWLRDQPCEDVGLIVNEVGEIDIDGLVIASQSDGQPIKMLPSGCLCCSLRDELVDTVAALVESKYQLDGRPLRKLIIETSGLARPTTVVSALLVPELTHHGLQAHIVCTFDCSQPLDDRQSDRLGQLASAQRVVLTKTDLIDEACLPGILEELKRINPLADVVVARDEAVSVLTHFSNQRSIDRNNFHTLLQTHQPKNPHPDIQVICRDVPIVMAWEDFTSRLDDLVAYYGEHLLRAKMLLNIQGVQGAVLLQSVGNRFGAPFAIPQLNLSTSRFVFILQAVDIAEFNALFDQTIGASITFDQPKNTVASQVA